VSNVLNSGSLKLLEHTGSVQAMLYLYFFLTENRYCKKKEKDDEYTYKKKLLGLSPRANYTDRAAAAGRR